MTTRHARLALLLCAWIARCAAAQAAGDGKNLSTTLTFPLRSEMSSNEFIATRMGWPVLAVEAAKIDYKIEDESFEVYVPEGYTGNESYGLLVWINPGGNGRVPRNYVDSIDKHKLIYVGPNNAGNNRFVRPRIGLALDAVHNMRKRYNIDPERIYASGVSGGGRVASMLGVGFADVFRGGGFYIVGCDTYRAEKSIEQNGAMFPRMYSKPPPKVFALAKTRSKHVFLTGDTDGNREQTEVNYKGFVHDGFEHCTYIQVPGMGHGAPNAEWFEKGMTALDEPLPPADEAKPQAKAAAAAKPLAPRPTPAPPAATQPTDDEAVAAALMKTARMYVDNGVRERAREKLTWIIEKYPKTRAATEAREILRGMDK